MNTPLAQTARSTVDYPRAALRWSDLRHRALARCSLLLLLFAITTPAALAQRLDLDAPAPPELSVGSVLAHTAQRLQDEADEFHLEHRALPEDAPAVEHLAMRARIAVTQLLADWLTDETPDPDTAATRHAAALALAAMLPRFDEACRAIVAAKDPAQHTTERLALDALLCLSDPDCRPMLRATARDDRAADPLIRAVADAFHDLIAAERPAAGTTLTNPVAHIAQRHHWSDNITDAWETITNTWSAQASRDPVIRAWIEPHFMALASVLESISADTTPRDTAGMDAARDLLASLVVEDATRPQRNLARVLHDAMLTDRTLRAIDTLGTPHPGQRNTAQPNRSGLLAARRAAHQRWLDGELPPGHIRVVIALERLAEARAEANRERPRSTESPGPIATERQFRATLDAIEAEIIQSLPAMITDRAHLTRPETVSLLARHQTAARTLINYLDLPARRAELTIEQGTGIEAPLIGRVNQRLARWQRETASNDPAAAERAHRGIAAHARLHAAHNALSTSALADLARAIDRPGLARADWREAVSNQRRMALLALTDASGTDADLAIVLEIVERLETFARLSSAARSDHAALARPLHRQFAPTIDLALTQLRDNTFGRALEPMATARQAAQALHSLQELLDADPVAAAALGTLIDHHLATAPLPTLRHAGRPWTPIGRPRAAAAHAIRWLGELDHARRHDASTENQQHIADHAIEQLQRYNEARQRSQ